MTQMMKIVAPTDVRVRDGFNPRTSVDDQDQADLVASIRELGILSPIVVERDDDGALWVLDGHRRLAAAVELDLPTVTVVARQDEDQAALARALVMNVRRAGLNPVDEAKALRVLIDEGRTAAEVAQLVGCPEDRVHSRLKLLALPEPVRDKIADRSVPMAAAPILSKVADVSPDLASAMADVMIDEGLSVSDVEDDPSSVIGSIPFEVAFGIRQRDGLMSPRQSGTSASSQLQNLGFDRDKHGDLFDAAEKWAAAAAKEWRIVGLTAEDIDAARAYGALVELDGETTWTSVKVVTDPRFAADRLQQRIDADIQKIELEARTAAKNAGVPISDLDEDPVKAQRRLEREKAEADRATAVRVNAALGAEGWMARASNDPLSLQEAQLFALLVLGEHDITAAQGARLCDQGYRTKTTKVVYADRDRVLEDIVSEVLGSRTPEEAIRRVLIPLLWGWLHDENAVPKSDRRADQNIPGTHAFADGWAKPILGLVADLVDDWAPDQVKTALAKKLADQERYTTPDDEDLGDDFGYEEQDEVE